MNANSPDRLEKATLDGLCKALGVQPGELLSYEPDEDAG
ncbi:helix-turn-helix transcriptional regulator [Leptolyngbya sp. FACHB-711]|nr:helix-turn-helix transcriptional regulator [Leptolyngbya sp. FACHB-711]MBD2025262.1 helix-turn-helix transcriptional regulator [Leptolyngbya sp. FACHB-711]